jgi:PIN domain nuclease of toxin-antitoxin system
MSMVLVDTHVLHWWLARQVHTLGGREREAFAELQRHEDPRAAGAGAERGRP